EMQEENDADERNNNAFLDQLLFKGFNGAIDQAGAVVSDGVFDIGGKSEHSGIEFLFDIENHLAGIGAVANDHDAADRFAFAVQLGDAAPHVRPELDVRDLAQENGHTLFADPHRDFAQVFEVLDVTAHTQDKFLFGHLDRAATHFAIAAFDGHRDFRNG